MASPIRGAIVCGVAAIAAFAAAGGWEPFRSDRAMAVIDFPGLPEEKISFVERPDFKLERVSYACESERAAYRLSSVLMPAQVRQGRSAEEILRSAALNTTPKDWTMRDEVWIKTERAAAVRFAAVPAGGFEAHHYLYLTSERLYTLVVVVPAGEASKCEVDRFFASFRPLDAVVPPSSTGAGVPPPMP